MTGNIGVLVLSGPPCAGKSSVARRLAADAPSSGRVLLEVDTLFSLLLPGSDRNQKDRMLAYETTHACARTLVERGLTVILECTYSRSEQLASLVTAVRELTEVPLRVAEFRVPPDEAVRRFRERQQETDLNEQLVRESARTFPYWEQALQVDSSTVAPDALVHQINTWLSGDPPAVRPDLWVQAGRGWVR